MLLWSGQTVSEVGSAVTQLALPLTAVVVLRASTFQVGLLTSAATAAFALVALPAQSSAQVIGPSLAGPEPAERRGLPQRGHIEQRAPYLHSGSRASFSTIRPRKLLCSSARSMSVTAWLSG